MHKFTWELSYMSPILGLERNVRSKKSSNVTNPVKETQQNISSGFPVKSSSYMYNILYLTFS